MALACYVCLSERFVGFDSDVCSLTGDVDLQVGTYTEFGKNFPKQVKMSPDGFVQNAILYTYYK